MSAEMITNLSRVLVATGFGNKTAVDENKIAQDAFNILKNEKQNVAHIKAANYIRKNTKSQQQQKRILDKIAIEAKAAGVTETEVNNVLQAVAQELGIKWGPKKATPISDKTAAKSRSVGKITRAIIESGSIPKGYNGADGKVALDKNGAINFTTSAEGHDVGFLVEFSPVKVEKNQYLTVTIQGTVKQKEGWAKYASIQVKNAQGKREILRPLCQSVWEDCTANKVVGQRTKKGTEINTTLHIDLPADLQDIIRFEIVFIGQCKIYEGFKIIDIDLKSKEKKGNLQDPASKKTPLELIS